MADVVASGSLMAVMRVLPYVMLGVVLAMVVATLSMSVSAYRRAKKNSGPGEGSTGQDDPRDVETPAEQEDDAHQN